MSFNFDKKKIEEEALKKHKERSELFKTNRFQFEIETRKEIDEFIKNSPHEYREGLLKTQAKWDKAMKGAGGNHNRLIIAKTLFMDQFMNVFKPAINLLSKGNK